MPDQINRDASPTLDVEHNGHHEETKTDSQAPWVLDREAADKPGRPQDDRALNAPARGTQPPGEPMTSPTADSALGLKLDGQDEHDDQSGSDVTDMRLKTGGWASKYKSRGSNNLNAPVQFPRQT